MTQMKSSGTVGPIIFSNPIARNQLLDDGEVVTFRKGSRTTGSTWWRESRLGPKKGDVLVEEIGEVDPEDTDALKVHRELSGFDSVDDWRDAICSLNGSLPESGYLYQVALIE